MIETHPYNLFVPKNATTLILGSFPGKDYTRNLVNGDHWYYSTPRNRFWIIMGKVYNRDLTVVSDRRKLAEDVGLAIGDLILKARRKNDSNLDANLYEIQYNTDAIRETLSQSRISTILCTSKFVEKEFKRLVPEFPAVEALPSPSPRYARMSTDEKVLRYQSLLPKI